MQSLKLLHCFNRRSLRIFIFSFFISFSFLICLILFYFFAYTGMYNSAINFFITRSIFCMQTVYKKFLFLNEIRYYKYRFILFILYYLWFDNVFASLTSSLINLPCCCQISKYDSLLKILSQFIKLFFLSFSVFK